MKLRISESWLEAGLESVFDRETLLYQGCWNRPVYGMIMCLNDILVLFYLLGEWERPGV